jgi:hypothetical protein
VLVPLIRALEGHWEGAAETLSGERVRVRYDDAVGLRTVPDKG